MDVAHALLELSNTNVSHVDQCTQTEELIVDKDDKETQTPDFDVDALRKENASLRRNVFGISNIQGDDKATKYFTGLPTWAMFLHLYMFLSADVSPSKDISL